MGWSFDFGFGDSVTPSALRGPTTQSSDCACALQHVEIEDPEAAVVVDLLRHPGPVCGVLELPNLFWSWLLLGLRSTEFGVVWVV